MPDAEKNVPTSDVLVSNESPLEYENGVKTGKSNVEAKTVDQFDSKGEDLKNARSEIEDQLNSKSQPEGHGNAVLENETPTIDAGTNDMVSGYLNLTDDELQNIVEGDVNEVQQSEKMIYEVNQNGNDLTVARLEDLQMKANPTIVTTDGDARSYEFPKVELEVIDSLIEKTPEPASPMFLINPSTANAGQHSGEASENISAMMANGEDDEGSPEDQAAFLRKLGTFYREKAMEFKPPRFYGHQLNFLKFVLRLGGYDRVSGSKLWRQVGDSFNPPKTYTTVSWTFRNFYEKLLLQYERHRTQNGELQLPIVPPPGSSSVDNEDRNANNSPKRAKSLKNTGSLKHQGQNEMENPMKAEETETSKQLDVQVVDVGPPANWVKINVPETVRVQFDPAGRLVITGQPNQLDNLWGVTGFKKVVILPARIDQLRTNAVVSLHGCLHVEVPFAQQNL